MYSLTIFPYRLIVYADFYIGSVTARLRSGEISNVGLLNGRLIAYCRVCEDNRIFKIRNCSSFSHQICNV